jgi:predicted metal-dependent hydrolase
MGTRDVAERELIQGLIKLAAAFVHQARGNPKGVEKNLRGARERIAAGADAGERLGVDVAALLVALATRLERAISVHDGAITIPRALTTRR